MIIISVTGLKEQLAELDNLERHLPYATALALTRTAQEIKADLVDEMQDVFDRPTRWTLDSLYLEPAGKNKLEARVWLKDEMAETAAPGTPAGQYLIPQVHGGGREFKGVEKMLYRKGALAAGQYLMPGQTLPRDKHGNIGRGQLTRILSGAGVHTEEGYTANSKSTSGKKKAQGRKGLYERYFLMRRGLSYIGIGERTAWGKGSRDSIRLAIVFANRRPNYRAVLDFYGIAQELAEERLPIHFEAAMAQAIASRRR
ncbi:hypothetical protein [Pseudomonas sp.]|uniref:hypothetical protein n=1 Tax=Pseudomonas sp. TaxID=306 RepID=UPI003D1522E2